MGEWIEIASLDEFADNDRKLIDLDEADSPIALFKLEDGSFAAVSVWCSHQRVSLMDGEISGNEICCSAHGARFNLQSGEHLCPPAFTGIPTFPVKVENGKIYTQLD